MMAPWVQKHREWCRRVLIMLKDKPCKDCEMVYPSYVMDFHHRDPKVKEGKISQLATQGSLEKLLNEIEKCDLVCANCHRLRTHRKVST